MNDDLSRNFLEIHEILRILLAFTWGWGYGLYLHTNTRGLIFEREQTWLATVIGIGVDLVIAFGLTWWGVTAVIGASSVGIVVTALVYGYGDDMQLNKYRAKQLLEDTNAITGRLLDQLTAIVKQRELSDGAIDLVTAAMVTVTDIRAKLIEIRQIARGIK